MGMMSLLKKEISGISGKFNFYNADELALKINFKLIFRRISYHLIEIKMYTGITLIVLDPKLDQFSSKIFGLVHRPKSYLVGLGRRSGRLSELDQLFVVLIWSHR